MHIASEEPTVTRLRPALSVAARSRRAAPETTAPAARDVPLVLKVGDQEYRGTRLARLARRAHTPAADVELGMDVCAIDKASLRKDGWIDLGSLPVYTRVLDAARVFEHRFAPRWMRHVGQALNGPLALADYALRHKVKKSGLALRVVSRFSHELDALWPEVAAHYPVLARRSAFELNRRYAGNPSHRLLELSHQGRLVGYAVMRFLPSWSEPAAHIVDYLCAPAWTLLVLATCLDLARRAKMAVVSCLHVSPDAARVFPKLGFLQRRTGWSLLVRAKSLPPATMQRLCSGPGWFVTQADVDVGQSTAWLASATIAPRRVLGATAEQPYSSAAFAVLTNSAGGFIRL